MKINFESKCIVVSNTEMKRAQNYGSYECDMLMRVMKELPDFRITVQQTIRRPSTPCARLTYEMMEQHIEIYAPEKMEEFLAIRACYRHYSQVKQWFMTMFPDVRDTLQFVA